MALALPHTWKTDAQCVKSPKFFPQLSASCSSTRDSREASLDKALSQSSSQCISKEVSEPITPVDNISQSNTCCDKKPALFSLFNSKLYLVNHDYLTTDMSAEESQEPKDVLQSTTDIATINDEEVKKILGQDLADLILANSPTDSVS